LRLIQSSDEEGAVRQFHGAQLAVITERREAQTGSLKMPVVSRIHFVVAKILFFNLGGSIDGGKAAAGCNSQLACAGEFWSAVTAIGDRAPNRSDDEILRAAAVLRRICVGDSSYVAGIL
jgi:hypothetical protein